MRVRANWADTLFCFLLFVAMHSVGIIIIIIIIGSAGSGFLANERNCILKGNIIVLLSNLIFT